MFFFFFQPTKKVASFPSFVDGKLIWLQTCLLPRRFNKTLLVLFSCLRANAKPNHIWAWLPIISFTSWQHILSLSGCLRVHIYISQMQINLIPVSHHQLTASGHLTAHSDRAWYHYLSIYRATVFGSIIPHNMLNAVITIPSPLQTQLLQSNCTMSFCVFH